MSCRRWLPEGCHQAPRTLLLNGHGTSALVDGTHHHQPLLSHTPRTPHQAEVGLCYRQGHQRQVQQQKTRGELLYPLCRRSVSHQYLNLRQETSGCAQPHWGIGARSSSAEKQTTRRRGGRLSRKRLRSLSGCHLVVSHKPST